jgi:phenylacetate-CoA ligase
MTWKNILLKRGLRSDSIWTLPFLYRGSLKNIVLFFDTRALLKSQYWPRERLDALANARVRTLIREAAAAFWKDIFTRADVDPLSFSLADLPKLPIISKNDFISRDPAIFINEKYLSQSYRDYTSGSTGTPFGFYVDTGYVLRAYAVCERMFRVAGRGTRFPILSMRARHRNDFAFKNSEFFYARGYNGIRHRLDDFIERASSYSSGVILYSFPSMLAELARLVSERGVSLPVRAIIASAEEMRPHVRAMIEQTFGAEAHMCYGTRELGWLAFECERHRLHINEESVLIEIVDASGKAAPAGAEGRIVVTPFDQRVMSFIRYFSGDLGAMETDPCPCGRTLRTMRVKGRESQMIELEGGRIVSLLELASHFDAYFEAVRHYQIIQTGSLSFIMRIVAGPSFAETRDALHDVLVRLLHPRAQITWETVEAIAPAPSGKAIYFVRALSQ